MFSAQIGTLEHTTEFMFCMGKAEYVMQKRGLEDICMNASQIPHCVKNSKNKKNKIINARKPY